MLVPMQIQFNITLNEDGELIHMANSTDAGRIVIDKFELWLPKLIPKDSVYSNFVSSFMKESKWKYLRELYEVSQPTQRKKIQWSQFRVLICTIGMHM